MSAARQALRLPAYAGIGLVHAYRWTIGVLWAGSCKYHPTCSQYAVDALREHGALRGTVLAAWRVLRCNPWSAGGVDHAHDQTLFRRRAEERHA
jgi:putative membrane protein insertion efficiency factor